MKILMIINPTSGKSSKQSHLIEAINIFCAHNHEVEVYFTQRAMDGYRKVIEKGDKFDLVIACGGDGTLNEVINGLMTFSKPPYLGYFPSGTMNDFGSNFNLNVSWKEIAERICKIKPKAFDVGKFGNRYFDYVAAFGTFCEVTFTTDQKQKEALGNLAYVIEGISRIPDIKAKKVKVTIDDKTNEYNAIYGMVLSGYRAAGIEFIDKDKGVVDDGIFNVLIVDQVNNIFEIPNYLSLFAKQNNKYCHWLKAKEVSFEFAEPTKWTLDGEEATVDKKVTVTNMHKALEILC